MFVRKLRYRFTFQKEKLDYRSFSSPHPKSCEYFSDEYRFLSKLFATVLNSHPCLHPSLLQLEHFVLELQFVASESL